MVANFLGCTFGINFMNCWDAERVDSRAADKNLRQSCEEMEFQLILKSFLQDQLAVIVLKKSWKNAKNISESLKQKA